VVLHPLEQATLLRVAAVPTLLRGFLININHILFHQSNHMLKIRGVAILQILEPRLITQPNLRASTVEQTCTTMAIVKTAVLLGLTRQITQGGVPQAVRSFLTGSLLLDNGLRLLANIVEGER
jgi:hypothetical protein